MKLQPHQIHGQGRNLYEVDFGGFKANWGLTLAVRADNPRGALKTANGFDITRIFTLKQLADFCKEEGSWPMAVRIRDCTHQKVVFDADLGWL